MVRSLSPSDRDSDAERARIAEIASEIAGTFAEAIDEGRLEDVPDQALGQLFASVVRLYAAKAQVGNPPLPFARNSGICATDVMIGCTAMLEAVNVPLFDLNMWQAWTRLGRRDPEPEETKTAS